MILVADDDPVFRSLLLKQLARLGHQAVGVCDGQAAVEERFKRSFKLILMDVMMPILDGLQATQAIRNREIEEGNPRVPIIAVTAGMEKSACMQSGMDDYRQKPLVLNDLKVLIAEWTE